MKQHNQGPASPLLTPREVADLLRVETTTVRRWIKIGALASVALPCTGRQHAYRVQRSTIDAILADRHASC